MKSIFLFLLLFLLVLSGYSQFEDEILIQIRIRVKKIDANIDRYEKLYFNEINLFEDSSENNYSLEGDELYRIIEMDMIKYFDERELVKIEVTFTGTHGNMKSQFYFDENQLVFVRKNKYVFHKSRYHPEFDESKYSMLYSHFYFNGDKLLKWVYKEKDKLQYQGSFDPQYSKMESAILHDVELYRDISNADSQ